MHIVIIIGIILIAVGTYLTIVGSQKKSDKTNGGYKDSIYKWIQSKKMMIILGVALIAIGTYLTILGGKIEDDKVSDEIKTRLQETKDEIQALKKESNIDTNKINEIDNKFRAWADDLIENKKAYKIEIKKDSLNEEGYKIKLSNEWYDLYAYFFHSLDKMIEAYNNNSELKIIKSIPDVPLNLFSEEAEQYYAKIKFSDKKLWFVYMNRFYGREGARIPQIKIIVVTDANLYNKKLDARKFSPIGDISIDFSTNLNIISVDNYIDWRIKELGREFDLGEYKESLYEILNILLKHQILM